MRNFFRARLVPDAPICLECRGTGARADKWGPTGWQRCSGCAGTGKRGLGCKQCAGEGLLVGNTPARAVPGVPAPVNPQVYVPYDVEGSAPGGIVCKRCTGTGIVLSGAAMADARARRPAASQDVSTMPDHEEGGDCCPNVRAWWAAHRGILRAVTLDAGAVRWTRPAGMVDAAYWSLASSVQEPSVTPAGLSVHTSAGAYTVHPESPLAANLSHVQELSGQRVTLFLLPSHQIWDIDGTAT